MKSTVGMMLAWQEINKSLKKKTTETVPLSAVRDKLFFC